MCVTMNRLDHNSLYGRKDEIDYLQDIVASVLRKGDFVIDQPHRCLCCFGDCDCTVPTESTSHSEDDLANCDDTPIADHHSKRFLDISEGGSRCHFVVVSGPPDIGKRTLVTAALNQSRSAKHQCSFLLVAQRFQKSANKSGSRMRSNRPFAAMTKVFQEIFLILSLQSTELRFAIRQKLSAIVKDNEDMSALFDLIPCVKEWFQEAEFDDGNAASSDHLVTSANGLPLLHVPPLAMQQTHLLFPVLQDILHAVVSYLPVVVLLEDLHFADEASLAFIKSLYDDTSAEQQRDESSKGLLLLATHSDVVDLSSIFLLSFMESSDDGASTYRAPADPWKESEYGALASSLNVYRSRVHQNIHQIVVSDLTWDGVREWVQDCGGVISKCSVKQLDDITDVVFHNSNGNPLHVRLLLRLLEQDETLLCEPIHKKLMPNKIDDLFIEVLLRQGESIQKVVQVIALLAQYGEDHVRQDILKIALNSPCMDIIETAHWFGLIDFSSNITTSSSVYVCRESVIKKAYDTILDASWLCLDIGRRIWSSAIQSQEKQKGSDNDVVSRVLLSTQLLRNSIDLLADIDERIYMSQLCYEAGQKSSASGDFDTSAKLFEFAIFVLGSELWRKDLYETSLLLHNAAAQAYCSSSDYENMNRMMDSIFENSTNFRDQLPAYLILVYAFGSRHQQLEAYRTTCMVLRELEEPINTNPGIITVISHFLKTNWLIRSKSDRFLRNLQVADDADFLLSAQFFSFASFHTYTVKPNFSVLLTFHLVRSILTHGISGPSAVALSTYAFVLNVFGNFDEGYRMGQLALEFADKFDVWRPRIYVVVYGAVNHWTCPFRDCLDPLRRASREALLYGDLEMYAGSAFVRVINSFHAGLPITKLEERAHLFCQEITEIEQKNHLLLVLPVWSLMNDLQGSKRSLGLKLENGVHDANSALKHCIKEGNKYMAGGIYVLKAMWCFFIKDYEQALHMASKSFEHRQVCDFALTFYEGLAALALARNSTSCLPSKLLRRGKKSARCVKRWADRCPENFRNKQWLLEAKIAALQGKSVEAHILFEKSIEKARHEGFLHDEAMAHEYLGYYQRHIGNVSEAKKSFSCAREAYQKWGASILVNRMDDLLSSA